MKKTRSRTKCVHVQRCVLCACDHNLMNESVLISLASLVVFKIVYLFKIPFDFVQIFITFFLSRQFVFCAENILFEILCTFNVYIAVSLFTHA